MPVILLRCFLNLGISVWRLKLQLLLNGKAVFCLLGGPASNEPAFLQIALPCLFHVAGKPPIPFAYKMASLTKTVGGEKTSTQFFYAKIKEGGASAIGGLVSTLEMSSRLRSQANPNALIKVPEGIERLEKGEQIQAQVLLGNV